MLEPTHASHAESESASISSANSTNGGSRRGSFLSTGNFIDAQAKRKNKTPLSNLDCDMLYRRKIKEKSKKMTPVDETIR
jgi:hypothetical protein